MQEGLDTSRDYHHNNRDNPRRRPREDYDDNNTNDRYSRNNNNSGNGGGYRGGYDRSYGGGGSHYYRQQKRSRYNNGQSSYSEPVPPLKRLGQDLVRISNNDDTSISKFINAILSPESVTTMEEKTTVMLNIISSLPACNTTIPRIIAEIYKKNKTFASHIITELQVALNESLNNRNRLSLLLSAVAKLTILNVIDPEDLVTVLDTIMSSRCVVFGEEMNSAEYFCVVVLETLLVCKTTLKTDAEPLYESLVLRIKEYMNTSKGLSSCYYYPPIISSITRLEFLYKLLIEEDEDTQSLLKEDDDDTESSCFVPFKVNIEEEEDDVRSFDPTFARVFDKDSGDICGLIATEMKPSVYYSARKMIEDITIAFFPKPEVAASQLERACSDHFKSIIKYKVEYVIMEALLLQRLSATYCQNATDAVYLDAIILYLVKLDSNVMLPALATVVEFLFRKIGDDELTTMATDALSSWFCFFLSNLDYKWAWGYWENVISEGDDDDPQRLFISTTLEKCTRQSYVAEMQKKIPKAFHVLLPPEPIIKFDSSSSLTASSVDEVTQWITENKDDDKESVIKAVTSFVLNAGKDTFSHTLLYLAKYSSILMSLAPSEEEEVVICKTVSLVWQNAPQQMAIVFNMMLRRGIITVPSVVTWVFSDDQQFSWPYVWEVVFNALSQSREFVKTAEKESEGKEEQLTELKSDFISALESMVDSFTTKLLKEKDHSNWKASTEGRFKEFIFRFKKDFTPELIKKILPFY